MVSKLSYDWRYLPWSQFRTVNIVQQFSAHASAHTRLVDIFVTNEHLVFK